MSELIGPTSLEPDAVVPQCLDNQFVSDAVFARMMASGADYNNAEIDGLRERDFKTEFIRSLVYSSQVIIQRAFLKNSDFLYRNYVSENRDDLTAFAQLMRDRAIVPFLFKERSLLDELEFDLAGTPTVPPRHSSERWASTSLASDWPSTTKTTRR